MAQKALEVNMSFQGVGNAAVIESSALDRMYSLSAAPIQGLLLGVSNTSRLLRENYSVIRLMDHFIMVQFC